MSIGAPGLKIARMTKRFTIVAHLIRVNVRKTIPTLLFLFACTLGAADKIIPAAAHAPGANATFFQTDVRIVNLASTPATVEITWLPSNTDNSTASKASVTIGPRATHAIDDAVLKLFAVTNGGGALRLTSASDFAASSRTYTTSSSSGCSGTFGQYIAAIDSSATSKRSVIPNVRTSSDPTKGFRTNIGVVNLSATTASVTLRLRDSGGALIATSQLGVLPFGHTQNSVTALFNSTTLTNDNLFVEVDASTDVIAYGSVIDNQSGDPIFIFAAPDSGTPAPAVPVIVARQWVFEPDTVKTKVGQETTVVIKATDVDHGVGFSGVGPFSCSSDQAGQCVLRPGEEVTIRFTPRNAGSFAFFCTRFCGASDDGSVGHATMRGTIVVE